MVYGDLRKLDLRLQRTHAIRPHLKQYHHNWMEVMRRQLETIDLPGQTQRNSPRKALVNVKKRPLLTLMGSGLHIWVHYQETHHLTFKTHMHQLRMVPSRDMDFQPHKMHCLEIKAYMEHLVSELNLQDFNGNADFHKVRMQIQELRQHQLDMILVFRWGRLIRLGFTVSIHLQGKI